MNTQKQTYFLCGAGGSGMSALAAVLCAFGHEVRGSDRNYDRGLHEGLYSRLSRLGVRMYPQDGSGIDDCVNSVVVSSAVEPSVPDIAAAQARGLPVLKRADLLATIVNGQKGIAVGGTSGKSTVTGMIGWCLHCAGLAPLIINGAEMKNFAGAGRDAGLGNVLTPAGICGEVGGRTSAAPASASGSGSAPIYAVYEADESDGSIALYTPYISVLTNISEDHKNIAELRALFSAFAARAAHGAVLNLDCPEVREIKANLPAQLRIVTYSLGDPDADICAAALPEPLALQVPGAHNRSNALAAIACARLVGIDAPRAAEYLASFRGIKSRLEPVGAAKGVRVIDDFAHNPDKIAASLKTLKEESGRILLFYQPHGYGPLRMHKDALAQTFLRHLGEGDRLYLGEVYDAGGTADRSVSSQDVVRLMQQSQDQDKSQKRPGALPAVAATYCEDKNRAQALMLEACRPGDRLVVMGARDESLREMAAALLAELE